MRRLILSLVVAMSMTSGYGQIEMSKSTKPEIFLKAGFGTSWIILPKVFLIDPDAPETNGQVLPATNGLSGYVGFQSAFHLKNGWLFAPGLDLTVTSGEIRINRTTINPDDDQDTIRTSVQNVQSYAN